MGLTKAAQIKRAQDVGLAVAENWFKDMQDPKNRGPKFTWEKFPEMVARHSRSHSALCFPHEIGDDIKDVAEQTGRQKALELVQSMKADAPKTQGVD